MYKKIAKFSVLPALLALVFLSFSNKGKNGQHEGLSTMESSLLDDGLAAHIESIYTVDSLYQGLPLLRRDFTGFKEAVGHSESRGQYQLVNRFGYMGKYQFGKSALAAIGIYDTREFLESPELQEAAFKTFVSLNKWTLRKEIARYSGKTIDGVLVTESGILAAAHLAGPTGVRRFLESNGNIGKTDAFGTHVKHYLMRFASFDLEDIPAQKSAKVDFSILMRATSKAV